MVPCGPLDILGGEVRQQARLLPAQPTRLVGRESELAVIRRLLLQDDVRLLTLTGPAGIGKTRLAVAAAQAASGAFTDGACFVDLATVDDSDRVVPAIADALGVGVAQGGLAAASLEWLLRGCQLLVVLDNCEHLLRSAADVGRLIAAVPGLKVLATSREPLRLRWEQRFLVPPLALPDLRTAAAPTIATVPSVALFVDRARAVRPDFALARTPEHARAVAEICVRLDGLPLAVELAAAQIGILSPTDILALLDGRLPLPPWRAADAPARHQTLRAAIDWSYRLLSPDEQGLLRHLAVFAGSWTLAAAAAVTSGASAPEDPTGRLARLVHGIGSLVDRSLVQVQIVDATGETRYRLLEVVREFARVELEASGEAEAARQALAAYLPCLADEGLEVPDQPALPAPTRQRRWGNTMVADPTGSPALSDRERAVLSLIAGGLANKQIARRLAISERTVKVHVSSVLNKLGADNRARAAVLATRRGLL